MSIYCLLDLMSDRSARNLGVIFDDQFSFKEQSTTDYQDTFYLNRSEAAYTYKIQA